MLSLDVKYRGFLIFLFSISLTIITFSNSYRTFDNNHASLIDNEFDGANFDYMLKFNVPKAHKSGIYVDLGGSAKSSKGDIYRYPNGHCPVFGKTIILSNGVDFLERATGSGININLENSGFQIPNVKEGNLSPTMQPNIYECSKYTAKFKLALQPFSEKDNDEGGANCVVEGKDWICVYHPFVYDTNTKMCYILIYNWQKRSGVKNCNLGKSKGGIGGGSNMVCFEPVKNLDMSHMVYGSSFIINDFERYCSTKPLKHARFGVLKGQNCYKIDPLRLANMEVATECGQELFLNSPSDVAADDGASLFSTIPSVRSYGRGINWATFNTKNKTCELYDTTPDCLIFEYDSFSFTSTGSININNFELAPCSLFPGVQDLEECILDDQYGTCGDGKMTSFVCSNGQWQTNVTGTCSVPCKGSSNVFAIAMSVIGTVAIIAIAFGGWSFYKKRQSSKDDNRVHTAGFDGGRCVIDKPDVLAETEGSFWGSGNSNYTRVCVDYDY